MGWDPHQGEGPPSRGGPAPLLVGLIVIGIIVLAAGFVVLQSQIGPETL